MAVAKTGFSVKSLTELTPSELRQELNKRLQKEEAICNVKNLIEVLKNPKNKKKQEK